MKTWYSVRLYASKKINGKKRYMRVAVAASATGKIDEWPHNIKRCDGVRKLKSKPAKLAWWPR